MQALDTVRDLYPPPAVVFGNRELPCADDASRLGS